MTKNTRQIFDDKVSLIYEYDKKSPLFVRKANAEIEGNNLEHAIEILNDGLKLYPDYAAAYLLLGKALTLSGNYGQALKNAKIGSDLIHSKKTYDYYLKEIENIKKQRSLFASSKRDAFLIEDEIKDENQPDLFEEELADDVHVDPGIASSDDENLQKLAEEISHAKISESSTEESEIDSIIDEFNDDSMIVSETLAKIYITQGEYKEAISVYKKLLKKNPEKSDYYNQKIEELESSLE